MKKKNVANESTPVYPPAFKTAVALAAIEGRESLAAIAQRYGVAQTTVERWKQQLIDNADHLFEADNIPATNGKAISHNELAITIAENSTQGLAMMNERGYCIYANRAWLQMTGYTAAEIGATVLHDLVHHHYPDGRPYPMTECPIDRALPENFDVRAHEDVFFRKDGSAFSVLCAASPIFKNGHPVATIIEIRDLTDKKHIDEEFRQFSARQAFQLHMADTLRTLLDPQKVIEAASRLIGEHLHASRVGYAEVDTTGKIASVDHDWTDGVLNSLAGKSRPLDSFGPAMINALRRGKTLCVDDIAKNPLSAPYTEGYTSIGIRSLITVPLLEGQHLTALLYVHAAQPRAWSHHEVVIVEDVARRTWEAVKRARIEEALRDETRILELLNQTGQLVASTLDVPTLLQSITDAATELSGAKFGAFFYASTDAQGQALLLYTLSGAPRDAFEKFGHPRATPVFGPTFHGDGIVRSDDITKDARYGQMGPHHGMPKGHLQVRSYLAVPVISRSGEVFGGLFFGHPNVGVFTERTERIIAGVAAQAGVALDNARLYEMAQKSVADREVLLTNERTARTEAERVSKMKDEFLAMLAHELRNPLAPISSAAELLNFLYKTEPRIRQTSAIISRQVGHMTRLVDDLLDVSRVTRGLVTLKLKPLDFRDTVTAALDQVKPLIDEKRHQVTIQLPNEPVHVMGDDTRLIQTVANILNNAAKYTPQAGKIDVKVEAIAGQMQCRVKDNGSGIAPELLPDLFELFTQGARTLARSQGGLGLGLALVKKLVELHGGNIAAHSGGNGQGSEFVLRLPLEFVAIQKSGSDGSRNTTDRPTLNTQPLPKLRLAVIDDNVDAADGLGALLRAQGHDVCVYYSAIEVLRRGATDVPHAFLIDIGLPDMDGYEVARRLSAQPHTAGSTLIAVTGYGQTQDRQRSKAAGFAHHLVKPVDMALLTAMLQEITPPTVAP